MKSANKPKKTTYYRALMQLWHTPYEAAGLDPIIPPGGLVTLDHLSVYQIQQLVDMQAVEVAAGYVPPAPAPDDPLETGA